MSAERRIEVRIPSRYQDVPLIRRVLSSVRDDIPLAPDALLKIEICVVESVGNAIRHAYGRRGDGVVEVGLTLDSDQLMIEVSDRGRAMSPEDRQRLTRRPSVAAPDRDDGRDAADRGLGFPLLRAVLDDLEYTSRDGWNTLRMTKFLDSVHPVPA